MRIPRVTIRARHVGKFMNFNFWVELDGKYISNEMTLKGARRTAWRIARALGEREINYLDFWKEKK